MTTCLSLEVEVLDPLNPNEWWPLDMSPEEDEGMLVEGVMAVEAEETPGATKVFRLVPVAQEPPLDPYLLCALRDL